MKYAPLAFGKDLKIEYDTDIKDLNGTFNSTEENSFAFEIAEADIKFNMYNSIPLKLALSATAIDLDGNPMDGVKASLDGEIMPRPSQKSWNSSEMKFDPLSVMMLCGTPNL